MIFRLFRKAKAPAAPAPPMPAAPAPPKRRAPAGEWDKTLPEERRMWAIMAADYGGVARKCLRPLRAKESDIAPVGGKRLTAKDIEIGEAKHAAMLAAFARRAATCAARALGEEDNRPRLHNQHSDVVAFARVRDLHRRETARKTGARFDWLAWFVRCARGVLWAYPDHICEGDPVEFRDAEYERPGRPRERRNPGERAADVNPYWDFRWDGGASSAWDWDGVWMRPGGELVGAGSQAALLAKLRGRQR